MKKQKIKKPNYNKMLNGYDIHKVLDFIKKHHDINPYDFYGSLTHYSNWCNQNNIFGLDPEGNTKEKSKIWYKKYKNAPDGEAACPKFDDFF